MSALTCSDPEMHAGRPCPFDGHEPMCSTSPLADDYNPFLLCDACIATLRDHEGVVRTTAWDALTERVDEAYIAESRLLRLFGMGSWLTRMHRRWPAKIVGPTPA